MIQLFTGTIQYYYPVGFPGWKPLWLRQPDLRGAEGAVILQGGAGGLMWKCLGENHKHPKAPNGAKTMQKRPNTTNAAWSFKYLSFDPKKGKFFMGCPGCWGCFQPFTLYDWKIQRHVRCTDGRFWAHPWATSALDPQAMPPALASWGALDWPSHQRLLRPSGRINNKLLYCIYFEWSPPGILSGMLSDTLCDILSGTLSDIFSLPFYLPIYLARSIWHSIWLILI